MPQTFTTRLALCLGAALAYILLFWPFYAWIGKSAMVLVLAPVLMAGFCFNRWVGLAAGLASVPLDLWLFHLGGDPVPLYPRHPTFYAAHAGVAWVGFAIGYMEELRDRLARELAERKKDQQALALSEQRFRGLYEESMVGHFTLDAESLTVSGCNQTAANMVGMRPDELRGKHLLELCDTSYVEKEPVQRMLKHFQDGKALDSQEMLLATTDGSGLWVLFSLLPIKDQEGRVIEGRGSLMDISSRKRAEAERLLRERLQAAIETAGGACHELTQPLQVLNSRLEMLYMQLPKDHELIGEIQAMLGEAQRMAVITRRLRNLTHYETVPYIEDTRILDLKASAPGSEDLD